MANILWDLLSILNNISFISWVVMTLFLLEILIDFLLNIMFIAAAHTKNYKLIKVYYYYMIVIITMYFLFSTAAFINIMWNIIVYNKYNFDSLHIKSIVFAIGFLYFVLEIYVIMLVKSELRKLKRNCQFRFTNNAAEAETQCKLNMAQGDAGAVNEDGENCDDK